MEIKRKKTTLTFVLQTILHVVFGQSERRQRIKYASRGTEGVSRNFISRNHVRNLFPGDFISECL